MKQIKARMKNFLTDHLNLPDDIVYNYPRVTLIGHIHLYIENHTGLIKFESNEIEVRHATGIIKVIGKNMVIKNLLKEEIVIEGHIDHVNVTKEERSDYN